jgi:hypothetical protein
MSTHQQRSGNKEQFWRRMVEGWRRRGLSVRAFCARNGLAEPTFYAWRRTLAQRDAAPQTTAPAFLPAQAVARPLFLHEHARGGGGHDLDELLDARALRDGVGQGTGAERLRRLTLTGQPAGLNRLSLAARRGGQRDRGIAEDGGVPALGLLDLPPPPVAPDCLWTIRARKAPRLCLFF